MSKVGQKPIALPDGVTLTATKTEVKIKGPKGEETVPLHPKVRVAEAEHKLTVTVPKPEDRRQRALWGTFRALLQNAVVGVTTGFERKLDIVGVGYKAAAVGQKLTLTLGYSHPIEIEVPKNLSIKIEKNTITVTGTSKQLVGEFSAFIRSSRPPEPYKGKGIKYSDEIIRRKAGKVVKAVGAG